jgi:hypothetical protein
MNEDLIQKEVFIAANPTQKRSKRAEEVATVQALLLRSLVYFILFSSLSVGLNVPCLPIPRRMAAKLFYS